MFCVTQMKNFSIRLTDEVREKLDRYAMATGKRPSQVIREAVIRFLEQESKPTRKK